MVSIIIPSYNRAQILLEVLKGLRDQTALDSILEIIVVDDGSTENISAVITRAKEWLGEKLLFEKKPHKNLAAALNEGLRRAQADLILFLGADMVPGSHLVEEHLRSQAEQGKDGKTAVVGYTPWHASIRMTPFLYYAQEKGLQTGFSNIEDPLNVSFVFAYITNISYPRHFLEEWGELFDEDLGYFWIDLEFAYRLQNRGLHIVYNKQAIAFHKDFRTLWSFCRRQEQIGYMAVVFYRKHPALEAFLNIGLPKTFSRWRRLRGWMLTPLGIVLEKLGWGRQEWLWSEVVWLFYMRGVERYFRDHPKYAWSIPSPFKSWYRKSTMEK